jgi:hypothetical protein
MSNLRDYYIQNTAISITSLILIITLLGCISNNSLEPSFPDSLIKQDEISFNSIKTDVSQISHLLGLQKLTRVRQSKSNEIYFNVEGQNKIINGENIDLNNSLLLFKKNAARKYTIETTFNYSGIWASLEIDKSTNSFTLVYNEIRKNLTQNVQLNENERLMALVLLNYYDEIRISNPYSTTISKSHTENETPINRSYYGYTLGWGYTREQSIDDELEVRGGAGEGIKRYDCKLLGTSTSCFYESIGCVTISTFKCTTND